MKALSLYFHMVLFLFQNFTNEIWTFRQNFLPAKFGSERVKLKLPGYSGTSGGKGGEEGSCPFPQICHQSLSSELHGMKLEFLSLNNKSAYLVEFIGSLCVMIT